MGLAVLVNIECPECARSIPAMPGSSMARCVCGHRIDTRHLIDCEQEAEPASGHNAEYHAFAREQHLERLREHWRTLHRFPFSDDWNCATRCKWWESWQKKIPGIGCDCRQHWLDLVKVNKPAFKSREAFFDWSIDRHNDVNERLGKPLMSRDDAWWMYARTCPGAIIPSVVKKYHHDCIQTGPAVDNPPAEPVRCDVVIPFCASDAVYLREAVESILAQEHAEPIIHIVADGCRFPELPPSPAIRLYRTDGDCGPYRITNALFPYFETDYLAIQDSDDTSTPDRLWKQIQTLERYGYDMISGGMVQFVAADCANDRVLIDRCKGMPQLYSGMCWQETPRGSMINSVKTMRLSLFERLNGFADWMMSADHEWDTRCAFTPGVRLYHATDVFGRRRLHNRSLSNGVFPIRSQQRDRYTQMMRQHVQTLQGGGDGRVLGGRLGRKLLTPLGAHL